jgi:hypothetical protein
MANPAGPNSGPPTDPKRYRRRLLEAFVAVLAFGVWGKLAYIGAVRLLARMEDVPLRGSLILDIASLVIGLSGSIAGISALYAVGMRLTGRIPRSLVGAPDDSPEDRPRGLPPTRRVGAKQLY